MSRADQRGGQAVRLAGRDLSRQATLEEAAFAIGAVIAGDGGRPFARVSTDSRKVAAGDLFFCLRGPTFDGHDFAAAVCAAGAAGVVCERGRGPSTSGDTAVLEVEDTLEALGDLAAWTRDGFDGPLVGVTGSNGKTTTKEMLRAIFLAHFGEGRVLATQGNLNNLIGVPLTLFGLEPGHHAAVIEMGMNAPGEIARLVEIAAPTVGLITCVAEAHLEGLGSIEGIARAKGELFEGLPEDAVAVVNADDANVAAQALRFDGRGFTFGEGAEVEAREVLCDRIDASSFELHHDGEVVRVELPLPGRHNVQNALGAAAAALAAGLPLGTIAAGLASMKPPPMRMSAESLANGVTLINDAYNANPGSFGAALATLGGLPGRRIVVIGDMLELGPRSAELHRHAGAQAAAIEPALLCAYGRFAGDVLEGAIEGGLDEALAKVCARHEDAAAEVAGAWLPGDAVLVKGSRGSAMEKVVEALRALAAEKGGGSGMIYHLLYPLASEYGFLNVLRYITMRGMLAAVLALTISLLLGPTLIRRLRSGQFGQPVSQYAPESHAAKKGTPTMGGLLIIAAFGFASLMMADLTNSYVQVTLAVTLGYAWVGFQDDWSKVSQGRNAGMSAREKLLWQFVIATAGMVWLVFGTAFDTHLSVPFFKDLKPELGLLYIPFGALVIVGASNAVNLTDGLDGLAIGPVMTTSATLAILSYCAGHAGIASYLYITHVPGAGELAIICAATAMAGLGFLWFNAHPAQMFMGDVGALALGAVLGTVSIIAKSELVLLLAGGVFVVEALSVIIQLGSIKLRGKRVFLMAPIHHHFEKAGWPETQVVVRCWIVSLLCAIFSLATLKLR